VAKDIPTLYLDSTVLITYTLTKLVETERYTHVSAMMDRINKGEFIALTSFYALHEVLLFALRNAPSVDKGRRLGKQAQLEILQTEIGVLPMTTREEKILHARTFAKLEDPSDASHAISALLSGCQIMVSYDQHFASLPPILTWKKPEEL